MYTSQMGLRLLNLLPLFCPYPFQISVMSFFYYSNFFYLCPCVGLFAMSLTPSFPSLYSTCCQSVGLSLSLFLPDLFCLLRCEISGAFCTHLGVSELHIFFSTLIFNSCLIQCFQVLCFVSVFPRRTRF